DGDIFSKDRSDGTSSGFRKVVARGAAATTGSHPRRARGSARPRRTHPFNRCRLGGAAPTNPEPSVAAAQSLNQQASLIDYVATTLHCATDEPHGPDLPRNLPPR